MFMKNKYFSIYEQCYNGICLVIAYLITWLCWVLFPSNFAVLERTVRCSVWTSDQSFFCTSTNVLQFSRQLYYLASSIHSLLNCCVCYFINKCIVFHDNQVEYFKFLVNYFSPEDASILIFLNNPSVTL